jgi:predicted DNA-binding WGR domain protein
MNKDLLNNPQFNAEEFDAFQKDQKRLINNKNKLGYHTAVNSEEVSPWEYFGFHEGAHALKSAIMGTLQNKSRDPNSELTPYEKELFSFFQNDIYKMNSATSKYGQTNPDDNLAELLTGVGLNKIGNLPEKSLPLAKKASTLLSKENIEQFTKDNEKYLSMFEGGSDHWIKADKKGNEILDDRGSTIPLLNEEGMANRYWRPDESGALSSSLHDIIGWYNKGGRIPGFAEGNQPGHGVRYEGAAASDTARYFVAYGDYIKEIADQKTFQELSDYRNQYMTPNMELARQAAGTEFVPEKPGGFKLIGIKKELTTRDLSGISAPSALELKSLVGGTPEITPLDKIKEEIKQMSISTSGLGDEVYSQAVVGAKEKQTSTDFGDDFGTLFAAQKKRAEEQAAIDIIPFDKDHPNWGDKISAETQDDRPLLDKLGSKVQDLLGIEQKGMRKRRGSDIVNKTDFDVMMDYLYEGVVMALGSKAIMPSGIPAQGTRNLPALRNNAIGPRVAQPKVPPWAIIATILDRIIPDSWTDFGPFKKEDEAKKKQIAQDEAKKKSGYASGGIIKLPTDVYDPKNFFATPASSPDSSYTDGFDSQREELRKVLSTEQGRTGFWSDPAEMYKKYGDVLGSDTEQALSVMSDIDVIRRRRRMTKGSFMEGDDFAAYYDPYSEQAKFAQAVISGSQSLTSIKDINRFGSIIKDSSILSEALGGRLADRRDALLKEIAIAEANKDFAKAEQLKKKLTGVIDRSNLTVTRKSYSDGGSLPVFHGGGVISQTGPIFAEKGERILPKKFAEGGVVGANFIPQTLAKPVNESQNIQWDDMAEKIKSAVGELVIKVDVGDAKVPVDTEGATVGVNVEGISIPVDAGTVAADIRGAMESANVKGAVGADALDELHSLIDDVHNKVLVVSGEIGDFKTEMIDFKSTVITSENMRTSVGSAVNDAMSRVQSDIDTQKNQLGMISGRISRTELVYENKFDESKRLANQAWDIASTKT